MVSLSTPVAPPPVFSTPQSVTGTGQVRGKPTTIFSLFHELQLSLYRSNWEAAGPFPEWFVAEEFFGHVSDQADVRWTAASFRPLDVPARARHRSHEFGRHACSMWHWFGSACPASTPSAVTLSRGFTRRDRGSR